MNVSGVTTDSLKTLRFVYLDHEQRAYLEQDGLTRYAAMDHFVARVRTARDKAEFDALTNLARYKFSNFGYHAARWVTLNALIGDKQPNPFRELVICAKAMIARKATAS